MSAKIAMLRRKNESFECILCESFIDQSWLSTINV